MLTDGHRIIFPYSRNSRSSGFCTLDQELPTFFLTGLTNGTCPCSMHSHPNGTSIQTKTEFCRFARKFKSGFAISDFLTDPFSRTCRLTEFDAHGIPDRMGCDLSEREYKARVSYTPFPVLTEIPFTWELPTLGTSWIANIHNLPVYPILFCCVSRTQCNQPTSTG